MPHVIRQTVDRISTITLNRPEKLNALAGTMREELLAALQDAQNDPACAVVLITGAGRGFCAGGDLQFMHDLQQRGDVEGLRRLLDAGAEVVLQIAAMGKPVLAVVNGVAAGAGCNLALACDYRLASEEAKFGQTFIRVGLHPDWGGTWLLPRLVGRSRALELLMSGRMVDAAEALRIGMVERVVPSASLVTEAHALAGALAAAPPQRLADIKRALSESARNDLRAQLAVESEHQLRAFLSAESAAAIAAFLR